MANKTNDLLQGALDLLVLRSLVSEPRHGWGILKRIEQSSKEVLIIHQGSLYPALYRLERQGFIKSEFGLSENNRKAKYYSLTKQGQAQLDHEVANWNQFASAIADVLQTA
ncbi:MAG: PadR family transcriptional regulator [Opitutales bacterium]|nr:PadR family transcriptional regulator [Opitutales bacterium]